MPEPIVVRDPEVCGGVPCIRGTRLTVDAVQAWVDHAGWDETRRQYPWQLRKLTEAEQREIMGFPRLPSEPRSAGDDHDVDVSPYGAGIDGCLFVRPADIPALTEAHASYERWESEVAEWEAERS